MARPVSYLPHFIDNRSGPDQIYRALVDCVLALDLRGACLLFHLAEAYWRFDCLRVPDEAAHPVLKRIKRAALFAASPEQRTGFESELATARADPRFLREACDQLTRLGPPVYDPRYMIDYVPTEAGETKAPDRRLAAVFDAELAWRRVLGELFGNLPRNPARLAPRRKVQRLLRFVYPALYQDNDALARSIGTGLLEREFAGYDVNVKMLLAQRGAEYFSLIKRGLGDLAKENEELRGRLEHSFGERFSEKRVDRLLEFHGSLLGAKWRDFREEEARLEARFSQLLGDVERRLAKRLKELYPKACTSCKRLLTPRPGSVNVDVSMSPEVLYRLAEQCLQDGLWDAAVCVFVGAEAFWRYDCLRVADPRVLGALAKLQRAFLDRLDEYGPDARQGVVDHTARLISRPDYLGLMKDWLTKLNPPSYEPQYVLGDQRRDGLRLAENFSPKFAWALAREAALMNFEQVYPARREMGGPWGLGLFGSGDAAEVRVFAPSQLLNRTRYFLETGNIRIAAINYHLADSYWRFDRLRRGDPETAAGDLAGVWAQQFVTQPAPELMERFFAEVAGCLNQSETRDWVVSIGRPAYESPEAPEATGNHDALWRLAVFATFGVDAVGRNDVGALPAGYDPRYFNNRTNPEELYAAIAECVQAQQFAEARCLYFLAEVYWRFDCKRVPGRQTQRVFQRIRKVARSATEPSLRTLFKRALADAQPGSELVEQILKQVRRAGAPTYEPTYLLSEPPAAAPESFDRERAWRISLEEVFGGPIELPGSETVEDRVERMLETLHGFMLVDAAALSRWFGTHLLKSRFPGLEGERLDRRIAEDSSASIFFQELEEAMGEAAAENEKLRKSVTELYLKWFGRKELGRLLEFQDTELAAGWRNQLDVCGPLGARAWNLRRAVTERVGAYAARLFPELRTEIPLRGIVERDRVVVGPKMSPNLLFDLVERCVNLGNFRGAVFVRALAEAFWRFDRIRVAEPDGAHALRALEEELGRKISAENLALLSETAASLAIEVQLWALRFSPPDYEPVYLLTPERLAAWDPTKSLASLLVYGPPAPPELSWMLANFATFGVQIALGKRDWRGVLAAIRAKAKGDESPPAPAEAQPKSENAEIFANRSMHPHALFEMVDRCLAADNIRFAAFIHFLAEAYWRFDNQRQPEVAAKFAFARHREEILARHSSGKLEQLAALVNLAPANAAFLKEARDWVTHALGLPTYKYLDDKGQPIPEPNLNFAKCWELALFATFATAGLPQDSQRLVYLLKRKPKAA